MERTIETRRLGAFFHDETTTLFPLPEGCEPNCPICRDAYTAPTTSGPKPATEDLLAELITRGKESRSNKKKKGLPTPDCAAQINDCGHIFHKLCLAAWLEDGHPSCPICRRDQPLTWEQMRQKSKAKIDRRWAEFRQIVDQAKAEADRSLENAVSLDGYLERKRAEAQTRHEELRREKVARETAHAEAQRRIDEAMRRIAERKK